jgi:CRP/FNR family transcriptional regulator/CRP/FNR family nitrogen fixation transcriptional regulator
VTVGQTLFLEGDEARHIYEVRSGLLRLTRVLENGRRQVIAFGLPGDVVGFPKGEHHHTDCDVIAEGEIVAHRREVLEDGLGDPELHARLLGAALREISAMQDHFMMLALKSAPEKFASFLMVLAERTGYGLGNYTAIDLAMKRTDIADFLGLTIETVSRTITQFRNAGIIALDGAQTIVLLDQDALEAASQAD